MLGRMKIPAAACLVAAAIARPVAAEPPLYMTFAACTGRLSAEMEHGWLTGDASTPTYERAYDDLATLFEATTPPDARIAAMGLRIEAKHAQRVMLETARFGRDPARAHWAAGRAAAERDRCLGLILRS